MVRTAVEKLNAVQSYLMSQTERKIGSTGGQTTSPVNGQIINIFGIVDRIVSLVTAQLFCPVKVATGNMY